MNSPEMRECIENCTNCHAICIATIQHCLGKGGRHANQDHIRLMADCAQICRTSADFMIRGSERHVLTCGVCAEICQRCAEDCACAGLIACATAQRRPEKSRTRSQRQSQLHYGRCER
jgi:hypothetical protein